MSNEKLSLAYLTADCKTRWTLESVAFSGTPPQHHFLRKRSRSGKVTRLLWVGSSQAPIALGSARARGGLARPLFIQQAITAETARCAPSWRSLGWLIATKIQNPSRFAISPSPPPSWVVSCLQHIHVNEDHRDTGYEPLVGWTEQPMETNVEFLREFDECKPPTRFLFALPQKSLTTQTSGNLGLVE